jgi:hypothetical protein
MFVLAILEEGQERNFRTSDIKLENGHILAVVGSTEHRFPVRDVINLVVIEHIEEFAPATTAVRSAAVN